MQGVWEKDEIRKDDSFDSFEEVLQMAVQQNVDAVILGGDLFHDNKPSRPTIIRAIDLFNKYCLSDSPVQFQVVSDQQQNFVSG
jgi:double-strand break repair protein MRE11